MDKFNLIIVLSLIAGLVTGFNVQVKESASPQQVSISNPHNRLASIQEDELAAPVTKRYASLNQKADAELEF